LIVLDSEDWPFFWHAPLDHPSVTRLRAVFEQANDIDYRAERVHQNWQNTVDVGTALLCHLGEAGFENMDIQVSLGKRAIYPAKTDPSPERTVNMHEIIGVEDKKVWRKQETYGGAHMFDAAWRFADVLYTSVKN